MPALSANHKDSKRQMMTTIKNIALRKSLICRILLSWASSMSIASPCKNKRGGHFCPPRGRLILMVMEAMPPLRLDMRGALFKINLQSIPIHSITFNPEYQILRYCPIIRMQCLKVLGRSSFRLIIIKGLPRTYRPTIIGMLAFLTLPAPHFRPSLEGIHYSPTFLIASGSSILGSTTVKLGLMKIGMS